MPDELARSIERLVPVFNSLDKSLRSERDEIKEERRKHKRLMIVIVLLGSLVVVAIGAAIGLLIYFHASTAQLNAHSLKIEACVFPPPKPSPPGTPLDKLSCYERGQVISTAEIEAILNYQRTLDQETINHFIPGNTFQLPPVKFALPATNGGK